MNTKRLRKAAADLADLTRSAADPGLDLESTKVCYAVRRNKNAGPGDPEQTLVQYVQNGKDSTAVGPINLKPKLAPGVYDIGMNNAGEIVFMQQKLRTDALLRFEDPVHSEILKEMVDFWDRKDAFQRLGFLHKRAILMFGPPGSGKSCIIKIAIEDLVKGGDVVFTCGSIYRINEGLKSFREVEPDRRCLVIMEDVDELDEHQLLQLLDGTDSADHILYLATTNYIDRLPQRVLRPSRLDRKIEVAYPPEAGRRAYLEHKLASEGLDDEQMTALVEATDGFSFGHLKELVIAAFCMGQPLENVLQRLIGIGIEDSSTISKSLSKLRKQVEFEECDDCY